MEAESLSLIPFGFFRNHALRGWYKIAALLLAANILDSGCHQGLKAKGIALREMQRCDGL